MLQGIYKFAKRSTLNTLPFKSEIPCLYLSKNYFTRTQVFRPEDQTKQTQQLPENTNQSPEDYPKVSLQKSRLNKEVLANLKNLPFKEKYHFLREESIKFARGFWQGIKQLWYNHKHVKGLKQKKTLSHREYRFLYQYKRDIKKVIPLLAVWKLGPFASLWLPFVFVAYPHMLPSTFELMEMPPVQTMLAKAKEHKRIFLSKAQVKDESALTLAQKLTKRPLTASYIQSLSFPSKKVDELNGNQLASLLISVGHSPELLYYSPTFWLKRRVEKHLKHIKTDDKYLHQKLENLHPKYLEPDSIERGLSLNTRLREQLSEWLKLSDIDPELTSQLLIYAHCFIDLDLELLPESIQQEQNQPTNKG